MRNSEDIFDLSIVWDDVFFFSVPLHSCNSRVCNSKGCKLQRNPLSKGVYTRTAYETANSLLPWRKDPLSTAVINLFQITQCANENSTSSTVTKSKGEGYRASVCFHLCKRMHQGCGWYKAQGWTQPKEKILLFIFYTFVPKFLNSSFLPLAGHASAYTDYAR